jgi:hypothetical protein
MEASPQQARDRSDAGARPRLGGEIANAPAVLQNGPDRSTLIQQPCT